MMRVGTAAFSKAVVQAAATLRMHLPTSEKTRFGMDSRLQTYVVEDNLTIRENLIGTLEELTPTTVVGFAETEGVARAWLDGHAEGWNLIVVDLFLKQGSGLGVLQACQRRGPGQKVVVLSNYATPDIRRRCADFGVDAVFDKSNEIEALVDFCLSQARALHPSPKAE
jgi:DNA-binding NarL/FixJ family response regulator